MTISITVPNDDEAALHYFGEAMLKLAACVRGEGPVDVIVQPITFKVNLPDDANERLKQTTEDLMQAAPAMLRENDMEIQGQRKEPEVDTTSQQVESLAIPTDGNGATYETDLGSDNPQPVCIADSNGMPWDERIHASSKALNSDGTWRVRRKPKDMTDDEWSMYVTVVKVESSQSQRESEELCIDEGCDRHGTPHVCITPEPPVAAERDNFHVDAGEVTEQQVAGIPPLPVPPLPVPPIEEKAAEFGYEYSHMTFPQVMAYLTERHGRISNAQVEQIIASMGLKSIMDLNTEPEHTGPFIARVKVLLGE